MTDAAQVADDLTIRSLLARYSRGIDRADWDLVRSCFHDDARLDYGMVVGTVEEFIAYASEGLAPMVALQHFLGQSLIELDGDSAWSETYVQAFHRIPGQPPNDLVVAARYVDRLERRDGEWRIAARTMITDWTRTDPVAGELPAEQTVRSRRDRSDPSYPGGM